MTLKEFAEQQGINYQTAKTWQRRGRIYEVSPGEFQVSMKHDPFETLKPETPQAETLKPETCGVTVERDALEAILSRLEQCERDNATLQRQVDALRDRCGSLEDQILRFVTVQTSAGPTIYHNSNYTGSAKSLGEPFND